MLQIPEQNRNQTKKGKLGRFASSDAIAVYIKLHN